MGIAPSFRRNARAWLVCLGCCLSLATVMGLGANVFSIYQPYLLELQGLTNAQGSLIVTIRNLFALLSMLTVDTLCRRIGLRNTIAVGMGCFVFSYALFGAASSFPTYCAGALLSGLAYGYGGMVPLTLVISRWFQARRGLALGLAAAGSGITTIAAPPILTWLIERQGLSLTFWIEGSFGIFLALSVFLLIRDCPADLGLTPYTSEKEDAARPKKQTSSVRLSRSLWTATLLAAFFTGGPCNPGFNHLAVLYTSEGFSSETVAALISYIGLVLMVSKVIYGQLSDILGSRAANYLVYGVALGGFFLSCLAPAGSLLLAAGAFTLIGLGMPLSTVSLSVWAGDLCAGENYDRAVKLLSVSYMLGALLTGPVPGLLADWLGSYVPAYILFFVSTLLSMVLIQSVYHKLGAGGKP